MQDILLKYQKQLKLLDWDITMSEVAAYKTDGAAKMVYNDYKASIILRAELSEEEKERTIIHELVHLIFRDAYDIFDENCKDEFAKTYGTRQHERAIEKMAKTIYTLNKSI